MSGDVDDQPLRRSARRADIGVRRRLAVDLVVLGVLGSALAVVAPRSAPVALAAGTTFVVDSTGDQPDDDPGDGDCEAAGGACTFRAAIEEANEHAGHDTIEFDIPGNGPHTIQLRSALQLIDDPAGVTIDGYTQRLAEPNDRAHGSNADIRIELRGTGPSGIDGLDLRSGDNVVRGIALFDFQRHIRMWGPNSSGNEIVGNFIGTDADAAFRQTSRTSGANGVHLEEGANGNLIGRPGVEHRNVIGGNGDKGIAMFDVGPSSRAGTRFNLVRNNVIGLAPDGVNALPNQAHGIDIGVGASDNRIGGGAAADRNVISGNDLSGVEISHNASNGRVTQRNEVVGNWIGTTADGSAGTLATSNGEHGVNLEGNERCITTCPPDITANTVTDNVIVGSAQANVIIWKGAHANVVARNRIGVLANGSRPASSSLTIWGVMIQAGAFDNDVSRNTIRFVERGIHVKPDSNYEDGEDPFPTFGNTFSRNSISDIDLGLGIALYRPRADRPPGTWWQSVSDPSSPLVNAGIARPIITSATTDRIVVDGCTGCRIEIFEASVPGCAGCFEAYGRGDRFLVDAVATGRVHTVVLRTSAGDPLVVGAGAQVSATVTDAAGNTSAFSRRVSVGSGGTPGPGTSAAIDAPARASASAIRCARSPSC